MKKVLFVFLFLTIISRVFSQNPNTEKYKYWYYRDRLGYFVYPGAESDNSVIMTNRNGCRNYSDSYPPYFSIEFG
ncbi:MAG: hypothetical protein CVU11_16670 [Bacteroidetes bacterium HGW-Bacteroidetes-6]|nr:MAG: hypothetical protein CVU11_16670 [Bacteroidetes bacterium HGW-Bacteroidetes-6]